MNAKIQFKLMLPCDVKAWLVKEAEKNQRSQGAQIVRILLNQMSQSAEAANVEP